MWSECELKKEDDFSADDVLGFYFKGERLFCCGSDEVGRLIRVLYYGYMMGKEEEK